MAAAFLYNRTGELVAKQSVGDPPPDFVWHEDHPFDRNSSEARFSDDGVEWLGWDYVDNPALERFLEVLLRSKGWERVGERWTPPDGSATVTFEEAVGRQFQSDLLRHDSS